MARYFRKIRSAASRLALASLLLAGCAGQDPESADVIARDSNEVAMPIDCVAAAKAAGLDYIGSRPAAGNPDLFTASSVTIDGLKACPAVTFTIEAAANSSIASAKAAEMYRAGAVYAAPAQDAPEGQEWIAIGFFRRINPRKSSAAAP